MSSRDLNELVRLGGQLQEIARQLETITTLLMQTNVLLMNIKNEVSNEPP